MSEISEYNTFRISIVEEEEKRCPKCGYNNGLQSIEMNYCIRCGAKLPNNKEIKA